MINQVITYITQLLGYQATAKDFDKEKELPYIIRECYQFYTGQVNGIECIFMVDQNSNDRAVGTIVKHSNLVKSITNNLPVIYIADKILSYNRSRLIDKKMPFIIIAKQLYLPFLGIALVDSKEKAQKDFSSLSVVAQLIVLGKLNNQFNAPLSISQAQELYSYSKYSIIKAFDELEYFQLAYRDDKTKYLTFIDDNKTLWEQSLSFLKSPIKRVVGLEFAPQNIELYLAGTSALADRTMLSELTQIEYATLSKQFNKLVKVNILPKKIAPIILELWAYPPAIITGDKIDPFSLFLTLKDNSDERVQIALDEMMENLSW